MNLIEISKKVLARLSAMDCEEKGGNSCEKLIFPIKNKNEKRISEQELRLLFIEEFKKANENLFYSIETPTEKKYSFGKSYEDIKVDENGQSALLDMCIFKREKAKYSRHINIEFKHTNTQIENIAKDILKLIREEQNGAFIHLLDNTNTGTLCNNDKTGVFDKLYKSFVDFSYHWKSETKYIEVVIMSLKQKTLIHCKICKKSKLETMFFVDDGCGNITEIEKNWNVETV